MMRVLIVSPHFPPVNAPDMQRIRMSLPRFIERGCAVTVLTVDDPTPVAPLDPELSDTLPPEVEIHRVRCLSRRWLGHLGINNVALRSLPFLFAAGCRLLTRRRYDVVYFSTTMFIVLPLGRIWRRLSGVPYVIDLQDPWFSDHYEKTGAPPPGGWKYVFARNSARLLEGWTLKKTSHLISVSEGYLVQLRARYPWFVSVPSTVLPFGVPDRDIALVRATMPERMPVLPRGPERRIAYVGRLGEDMQPALAVLFEALARSHAPLTIHFLGTSYAPAGQAASSTSLLAARHRVGPCVHEAPGRIGYLSSIQTSLEADATLVLGSTDLAYMPSKILLTLALGRPLIVVAPTGGKLAVRAAELPGVQLVTFSGPDDDAGITAATGILLRLSAQRLVPPADAAVLEEFASDACADRQLAILSSAAQHQRCPLAPTDLTPWNP